MAESSRATAHRPGSEPGIAQSLDLNRAAEVSGVALAAYSHELRHVSVNTAYAALVGSEPENITDRPLADVLGSAALTALRPFIDQVLRGERAQGTVRLQLAQRWCTLRLTFTPELSDRAVTGWCASFLDVTEEALEHEQLRESESTLRLVHMHGGEVEARSAGPDTGSEFIVRLPLIQQTTAGPGSGIRPGETSTNAPCAGGGR